MCCTYAKNDYNINNYNGNKQKEFCHQWEW